MKKIIITLAIAIMLVLFQKAKGQTPTTTRYPDVNVLIGADLRLSFRLWRFEPFIQLGGSTQLFQERITEKLTVGIWDMESKYNSRKFVNTFRGPGGIKFRITENDRIKYRLDVPMIVRAGTFTNYFGVEFFLRRILVQNNLGYVRKQRLTERINMDLYVLHTFGSYRYSHGVGRPEQGDFLALTIGSRLNFEIISNLSLGVQLEYARRYRIQSENTFFEESILIRNIIDFSIGIHYHFGGRQQQQVPQRPPRQRVAPSTFNHPTLPPRTR